MVGAAYRRECAADRSVPVATRSARPMSVSTIGSADLLAGTVMASRVMRMPPTLTLQRGACAGANPVGCVSD